MSEDRQLRKLMRELKKQNAEAEERLLRLIGPKPWPIESMHKVVASMFFRREIVTAIVMTPAWFRSYAIERESVNDRALMYFPCCFGLLPIRIDPDIESRGVGFQVVLDIPKRRSM